MDAIKAMEAINDICKIHGCSNCEERLVGSDEYSVSGTYCPNCGAKMDEAGE